MSAIGERIFMSGLFPRSDRPPWFPSAFCENVRHFIEAYYAVVGLHGGLRWLPPGPKSTWEVNRSQASFFRWPDIAFQLITHHERLGRMTRQAEYPLK
jgi:hypothetical protein